MPQVVDVGRKVAVDFDCPRLHHNADEREVPVVELRRLSGVDRVAELGGILTTGDVGSGAAAGCFMVESGGGVGSKG